MTALTSDELDAAFAQLKQSRKSNDRFGGCFRAAPTGKVRGNGAGETKFPAELIARLIRPAIAELGLERFAAKSQVPSRSLHRILNQSENVTLPVVDDLVTRGLGDPGLFQSDPELAAIYSG